PKPTSPTPQAADKGPSASLAPSAAGSTYGKYASPPAFGRRLAAGPFSPACAPWRPVGGAAGAGAIGATCGRWRPRPPAQRTESTPRRLPSGAASQLDLSPPPAPLGGLLAARRGPA